MFKQSLRRMGQEMHDAQESLRIGTAELSLIIDPPTIIRETIPIAACAFANVRATMKGIQVRAVTHGFRVWGSGSGVDGL